MDAPGVDPMFTRVFRSCDKADTDSHWDLDRRASAIVSTSPIAVEKHRNVWKEGLPLVRALACEDCDRRTDIELAGKPTKLFNTNPGWKPTATLREVEARRIGS